jgi:hypothetical protein
MRLTSKAPLQLDQPILNVSGTKDIGRLPYYMYEDAWHVTQADNQPDWVQGPPQGWCL